MDNEIRYFSGLDLAQVAEHTALAVLEQTSVPDPDAALRKVKHYAVRHLERFPLGTPFPAICQRLQALFAAPPLAHSVLAVDQTAVGEPVVRLLRRARLSVSIRPLTVTGGHQAQSKEDGGWLVPKNELVSTLQLLLQSRRLKVAPSLPEAQTLVRELQGFRVKTILSSNDTLESWRDGPHDDLVLSVAIAAWQSEHLREAWIR
jgi:hypothetical protein